MQLLCQFVGLNFSKKQNCYDLDGFIRPEYVTDFITYVDLLFPQLMFGVKWKAAVCISAVALDLFCKFCSFKDLMTVDFQLVYRMVL